MPSIITRESLLVTGGGGFIGANLVRKLLNLGYSVSLILKKSTNLWRIKDILPKLNIYTTDLLDFDSLKKTIKKINPSIIFHLATFSDYRNKDASSEMTDMNIKGTLNLLLATNDIDYKIFVNTGSSSEYGTKNTPMSENDLLEPISFYAATKAASTLLCQVFAKEYKKPIVTLRPFSVYGPYEEESRFIPTIIKSLIANIPIKLTSGNQRRDFIFVDDAVDMYIRTIKYNKKLAGQILNMGTGIEFTNDEVVKILFKVAGKKGNIKKGAFPTRIWDNQHWVADTTKVKKMLDWKPKYNLENGLKETYIWFRKSNFLLE